MKLLALILPMLMSCQGHRQLCAYTTDTGVHVFATRAAFDKRFHHQVQMVAQTCDNGMPNIGFSEWLGAYDRATKQCWAVARNPECPDGDALAVMDHELCHAVTAQFGWDVGKYFWARLAKEHPVLMSHRDINARLKSEHLWPCVFRGDFW